MHSDLTMQSGRPCASVAWRMICLAPRTISCSSCLVSLRCAARRPVSQDKRPVCPGQNSKDKTDLTVAQKLIDIGVSTTEASARQIDVTLASRSDGFPNRHLPE